MVRWFSLLPAPPAAWGSIVLVLGALSGLLGVVFAIGQHDLKRLLAYHSVENIGIILMGLGVAMLGRTSGRPEWVALGFGGCLLHVWNHSFFKSLLFLCAGAVLHSTGTRQIDRLGGLAKKMPWTAACFLVGAVAICGLPPLNGFVSEWFVYLGLFGNAFGGSTAAMVGVPVLATIGALAVACFVKVYGTVFLGAPRTCSSDVVHEAVVTMRLPMLVLASACVLIGLVPTVVVPALDAATACWLEGSGTAAVPLAHVAPLGVVGALAVALTLGVAWLAVLLPHYGTRRAGLTWDCGYARPTARMQYTASSFAQTIALLAHGVLRPHVQRPRVAGSFPLSTHLHSHVDDPVLDRALLPAGHRIEVWFNWCHRFQRGLAQHYVLYILLTLIALLCTLFPFKASIAQWFAR
jgi:hydrogenase-4 component B